MSASADPTPPADVVRRLACVALSNVGTEYPYHLAHMVRNAHDLRAPRELFPVFWGSYDWHPCVHMHWTLARCLRLGTAPVEGRISGIVDIPNACATLAIPTDIFDFDVFPGADGPKPSVKPGIDLAKA